MEGVGAGVGEDCREVSLDIGSALRAACLDALRGFVTVDGVGFGVETGSALDRMLEKAIGSAGLVGVCRVSRLVYRRGRREMGLFTAAGTCGSCFAAALPMATPLGRGPGEVAIGAMPGERGIEGAPPFG